MLRVEVINPEPRVFQKRDGSGSYQKQTIYIYERDDNGNEKPFPTEYLTFIPKDQSGMERPYQPGQYFIPVEAIQIRNGDLKVSPFWPLRPMAELNEYLKRIMSTYHQHIQKAA